MGLFSSKVKFKLPSYLKAPSGAIAGKVNSLIGKQYTPYEGERVAGMTGNQTQAMDMLKQLLGDQTTDNLRVIDDIPGASGGLKGTTQDYMNPFIKEALEPALRQLGISTKQAQMDVDAKANMAGAFGDTGQAIERAETAERGIQAAGDATYRAYADAFANAMGLKSADLDRRKQSKSQAAQLLAQLFNMGSTEQQTNQAALSADFEDWLRQQGFEEEHLAKLVSILGGVPTGQATTQPSTAASILGAAGGIGSLLAKI